MSRVGVRRYILGAKQSYAGLGYEARGFGLKFTGSLVPGQYPGENAPVQVSVSKGNNI